MSNQTAPQLHTDSVLLIKGLQDMGKNNTRHSRSTTASNSDLPFKFLYYLQWLWELFMWFQFDSSSPCCKCDLVVPNCSLRFAVSFQVFTNVFKIIYIYIYILYDTLQWDLAAKFNACK